MYHEFEKEKVYEAAKKFVSSIDNRELIESLTSESAREEGTGLLYTVLRDAIYELERTEKEVATFTRYACGLDERNG